MEEELTLCRKFGITSLIKIVLNKLPLSTIPNTRHKPIFKLNDCSSTSKYKRTKKTKENTRIRSHGKSLKCTRCKFIGANTPALKIHFEDHPDHKPFQCTFNQCTKSFIFRKRCLAHIRRHTALKCFKCKQCSYQTTWRANLLRHIRVVHEKKIAEKKITCPFCPKKFDSQIRLNGHMWNHTGEKPYFCQLCKKGFSHSTNKNMHELKCKQSSRSTGTDACWTEKREFKCEVCDFQTTRPSALRQHSSVHSMNKPHKCTICNFSTKRVSNLNAHMMIHTGHKRYKCPHCDLHVEYKSRLPQHIAVHHNEDRTRDYSCNFCRKSFYSKGSLNGHLSTHTGEKAYACKQCDYQTPYLSNFNRHNRSHNNVKPHRCPDCSYRSVSSDHLKRHMGICRDKCD